MSNTSAARQARALLRPRVFFPILLGVAAISVLLTQQDVSDAGQAGSSYSAGRTGASGLMESAQRLGIH